MRAVDYRYTPSASALNIGHRSLLTLDLQPTVAHQPETCNPSLHDSGG